MNLPELKLLKESEDKVEFKEARHNFAYNGGAHTSQEDRRKCYLGYVVALANEGGGLLVFGMSDKPPRYVVGTNFAQGRVGALEDQTYAHLGIRVHIHELHEGSNRVLVTHVPGRPIGRLMKFEGVPLMRTGDSLRNMSDEEMFKILSEQEPDLSAAICTMLTVDDLDPDAIQTLKERYAAKQNNKSFLSLPTGQVLSDLDLMKEGKLTFASLILLGKTKTIRQVFPQCCIHLEYRIDPAKIHFDDRKTFEGPFFLMIDSLWEGINARNAKFHIQQGPYILDIPYLNEGVVRESIHNAIVHRDYRRQSEIVIKQSNFHLEIINPGGFPLGVSFDNLLVVNSTPRNRLLADILLKTGIVERSGQGIDKLFIHTIQEAKGTPDYSRSDHYQVYLSLPTVVQDQAFVLFLEHIQREAGISLSLMEILTLEKIRLNTEKAKLDRESVRSLLGKGLIEAIGKTNTTGYMLSREYYAFTDQPAAYSRQKGPDISAIWTQVHNHLSRFRSAKMGDFDTLFQGMLNREQVKYHIYSLEEKGILARQGKGKGTFYTIHPILTAEANSLQKGLDKLKPSA